MAIYAIEAKFMSLTPTFVTASLHFVMTLRSLAILEVENPGTSIQELLVASDVKVHWQVCLHLWHVSTHQSQSPAPSQRAQPPPCSRCTMGHNQCRFHSGVARVQGEGRNHGSVMTCGQKGSLTACTHIRYWAGSAIVVWQSSKSSVKFKQCSVPGLLDCLLLDIV